MSEFYLTPGAAAVLAVVAGLICLLANSLARRRGEPLMSPSPSVICAGCGSCVAPEQVRPGSTLVAVLLLFVFVIPGVFYCLWRESAARKICPTCGSLEIVPLDSPRGRKLLEEFGHIGKDREAIPDEAHLRELLRRRRSGV